MPDWIAQAKTLPFNGRKKVQCCAADRSRTLYHNRDGYSSWCFRCHVRAWEPHGILSIAQVQERRTAEQELRGAVAYPKDFTLDIPQASRLWLQCAGITAATAKHYGIGYSARSNRVIVPAYVDGELVAVLARSTTGDKPKYIASMRTNYEIFFSDASLIGDAGTGVRAACITEDALSAIRVGTTVPSIALLGTATGLHRVAAVNAALQAIEPACVYVWLDPDKAGRDASRQLVRALVVMGWKVRQITSERDPKYYANADIRRYLSSA